MMHERHYAGHQGLLGSIDANTGDLLLGWDTDQFPTSFYLTTEVMLMLLKYGGVAPGGTNFDAKVRRESFEPIDLFYAHVGGMAPSSRAVLLRIPETLQGRPFARAGSARPQTRPLPTTSRARVWKK